MELLVPEVATLAVLQLIDEGQPVGQVMVACGRDEGTPAIVDAEAARMPSAVNDALLQAMQLKQRITLHPNSLRRMSAESFGLDGPLALRAAVAVPLMVGERVLGVLMVGAEPSAPGHPGRDWAALEELASRAAIAFENAHLYRSLQSEIVERRAAEAELQEANQRKDEFLAMLSHELRNPLAPIRNALEVIRRIAPPDPKFNWAGDVMDRQVRHLTRLVEELLDVARISQGKIQLNKEPIDLGQVIAQSVETAQPFIDARGHQLSVA